ncbi:MAG: GreA/GreB family elongation factor [Akkermansia sp.]|nr:GreA/GreB family elongation factor [Akkermansia sp.]
MFLRMHADLEKLVNAGKIPADFAARLDKFAPGQYVMHQDWGVGKVAVWSLSKNKIKIDFEKSKGLILGLKLAFNQLTPIPEGHFLIKCYDEPAACKQQAEDKDTMLEFIRSVLTSNLSLREGINEVLPMQPEDLEKFLSGRIIPEESWKNWWERARAAMRETPTFRLPTKRGEAIGLRTATSAAEALLDDYTEATTLETCVRILDQTRMDVLKNEFTIAARLIKAMEDDIHRDHTEPQHVLELIIIRDDILESVVSNEEERSALDAALTAEGVNSVTTLANKLSSITSEEIVGYIGELSTARQLKVYEALPEAIGDGWLPYATNIFLFGGAKVTATAAEFIISRGGREQLFNDLVNGISRQSLSPEVLIWICRERNGVAKEVVEKARMALGSAIISSIERDSADGGPNRALRLRNLLLEDKDLAPDLVSGISDQEARPFAKALYDSSVLPDLDRNLLLANMMRIHPTLQEIALTRSAAKEKQTMFVSLRSYAARKAEYEDIINVRIPKNKHDLEVTRAEGDLRENGGYQDAKATRQVLMRRSEELSRLLAKAEPTNFSGVSCEETAMGTQVTFVTDKGQEVVYTILGAWDSIPEERVIAYSSKLGAKLLGHKVGASLRLPLEIGGDQVMMTVKSIAPAPKELIYPDGEVPLS